MLVLVESQQLLKQEQEKTPTPKKNQKHKKCACDHLKIFAQTSEFWLCAHFFCFSIKHSAENHFFDLFAELQLKKQDFLF